MIESYCDSDDEVFFGPMTMREIKVIFNLRDVSKKKTEEGGCSLVQTQDIPAAESGVGEEDDISTDPSSPRGDQVQADDIASVSSMCGSGLLDEKIDTVLRQEMNGSSNNGSNVDCSVICDSSCSCIRCHNGQLDVACISIKESTCEGVGVLAQRRSPFPSNCDDMDDTLEEINKLLALGDELTPAVSSPKLSVGNVAKSSAAVAENGHDVCNEADVETASIIAQLNNETDTQAHIEHQYSSDVFDQSVYPVISQQSDGSGSSEHDVGSEVSEKSKSDNLSSSEKCSRLDERCRELASDSSEVSSSTDTQDKCESGSNSSWDKENVESRCVVGIQVARNAGERVVFAPPWKVGGSAQRPTRRLQYSPGARNKYAVQSPVGVYIRSSPAPSLVQNIRPTPRRATKASCTPDCKKVCTEAALATSSSLPVVRYASKSARVLVSKQLSAQKLPQSVKKLINTPEAIVTRHQGRFRLKNLPELRADVSSSDTEVSILVQKAAVKTRLPP